MIDLGNGYFIAPTSMGYNLIKDQGTFNKKTGERQFVSISYHGSLVSAVDAAMRTVQREALTEREFSLKEAVEVMGKIHKEFMAKLEESIGAKEKLSETK